MLRKPLLSYNRHAVYLASAAPRDPFTRTAPTSTADLTRTLSGEGLGFIESDAQSYVEEKSACAWTMSLYDTLGDRFPFVDRPTNLSVRALPPQLILQLYTKSGQPPGQRLLHIRGISSGCTHPELVHHLFVQCPQFSEHPRLAWFIFDVSPLLAHPSFPSTSSDEVISIIVTFLLYAHSRPHLGSCSEM